MIRLRRLIPSRPGYFKSHRNLAAWSAATLRRTTDRDARIGLLQGRRVVHPNAGHAHDVPVILEHLHDLELVFGKDLSKAIRFLNSGSRLG